MTLLYTQLGVMWFFVPPSGCIASLQTLNSDYIHKKTHEYLILHLNSHYRVLTLGHII